MFIRFPKQQLKFLLLKVYFYLSISGLHEGLDHLYDMIMRKRKMQKQKKKR